MAGNLANRTTTRGKWLRLSRFLFALALLATASPSHTFAEGLSNAIISRALGATGSSEFWAFQPRRDVALPTAWHKGWATTPVDAFILAKLEAESMEPAPPATRRELIRRLYFDLLGIPPAPADVEAFVEDSRPDAYPRLVDQLLADPRHGERWAQHWQDVVRFAETEGFEYDRNVPDAWRYRDYVIATFNNDVPYDQFILEQIAGDELAGNNPAALVAAGFNRLGAVRRNAGNQEVAGSRNEVLTERTDVVGAAFLGLTLGCARCHDHKFDPIRQSDYYRVQAYFAASEDEDVSLASPEETARWKLENDSIQTEIKKLRERLKHESGDVAQQIRRQIQEAEDQLPSPPTSIATIRNSVTNRTPIHVLKRGEWANKGDRVEMSPPEIFCTSGTAGCSADSDHPRTALAHWLASPRHPLTARVMVNRIWQHHFGQGIVKTPNDFGANGSRPSHPELLDFLANELIRNGWRLKPIHRMILLSRAYQQSSITSSVAKSSSTRDPENRWLWHFNRRRLDAEELRDAMLSISGRLNSRAGGPSIMLPVDAELVNQLYKPSQWVVTRDPLEHDRRSVYLLAKRNLRVPFMEVFDQPMLQTSCARREASTHAPQALELLNGSLANDLARAFAARLAAEAGPAPRDKIRLGYALACGRAPNPQELQVAEKFLRDHPPSEFALALFNLNSFLYVL